MIDRMAALERVAEAARGLRSTSGITSMGLEDALAALDALPAEPADAGEMVEVRGAVMWDSGEAFVVPPSDIGAYTGIHIATITARIPRPVVPEVRAEVET